MAEQAAAGTITINDRQYNVSDLSDNARRQIQNIRVVDEQITRLRRELAIAQTARSAYAQALDQELPKPAE